MKPLAIILLLSFPAASQDITISIGTSHYLGDLGGNKGIGRNGLKDFNLKSTGVVFSVGYDVQQKFALQLSYVTLHDNDKYAKLDGDSWYRWIRGYKFKTSIIELSILKKIQLWETIYLKSGFGAFYLLSVNETERSVPAAQFSAILTVGLQGTAVGLKPLGLEICYRKLFTDYVDGYSLRADPKDNDSFFTISLSYTLKKKKGFEVCPKY